MVSGNVAPNAGESNGKETDNGLETGQNNLGTPVVPFYPFWTLGSQI